MSDKLSNYLYFCSWFSFNHMNGFDKWGTVTVSTVFHFSSFTVGGFLPKERFAKPVGKI